MTNGSFPPTGNATVINKSAQKSEFKFYSQCPAPGYLAFLSMQITERTEEEAGFARLEPRRLSTRRQSRDNLDDERGKIHRENSRTLAHSAYQLAFKSLEFLHLERSSPEVYPVFITHYYFFIRKKAVLSRASMSTIRTFITRQVR